MQVTIHAKLPVSRRMEAPGSRSSEWLYLLNAHTVSMGQDRATCPILDHPFEGSLGGLVHDADIRSREAIDTCHGTNARYKFVAEMVQMFDLSRSPDYRRCVGAQYAA